MCVWLLWNQPVVFLPGVCVCVCGHGFAAFFAYRACYTSNLEGVALLHPQSHACGTTPFSGNCLIVATGLREHQHAYYISRSALFAAENGSRKWLWKTTVCLFGSLCEAKLTQNLLKKCGGIMSQNLQQKKEKEKRAVKLGMVCVTFKEMNRICICSNKTYHIWHGKCVASPREVLMSPNGAKLKRCYRSQQHIFKSASWSANQLSHLFTNSAYLPKNAREAVIWTRLKRWNHIVNTASLNNSRSKRYSNILKWLNTSKAVFPLPSVVPSV